MDISRRIGPVLVLAGGLTHERDVSLRSGRRLAVALDAAGVDVIVRDADSGLLSAVAADPPLAVFPTLHGASGEDGSLRDVLDLLGLPYVGADGAACRAAFDKTAAKAAVAAAGLATPDSVALPQTTFRDLGAGAVLDLAVTTLGLPLMVKPNRGGSALGASVVRDRAELPAAMMACFSYDGTALLETFVAGTEVAVSVIDTGAGPEPLPVVEIVPDSLTYDYDTRYTAGSARFFVPARLDAEATRAAQEAALRAHEVLGLRDLSRTDLIIDAEGRPWYLEVNVAPGLTETSLLPMAAAAAERELGQLCRALVEQAAGRGPLRRTSSR